MKYILIEERDVWQAEVLISTIVFFVHQAINLAFRSGNTSYKS